MFEDYDGNHFPLFREEDLAKNPALLAGMSEDDFFEKVFNRCEMIKDLSLKLEFQTTVIVNAMLLFHRYFQFELLEHKGDYPKDKSLVPYVRNSKFVAVACVFLSGKVNDTPRSIQHVLWRAHLWFSPKLSESWTTAKERQDYQNTWMESKEYESFKNRVISAELDILKRLDFNLDFTDFTPHVHLLELFPALAEHFKHDSEIFKQLRKKSWDFANASAFSPNSLVYTGRELAVAVIKFASHVINKDESTTVQITLPRYFEVIMRNEVTPGHDLKKLFHRISRKNSLAGKREAVMRKLKESNVAKRKAQTPTQQKTLMPVSIKKPTGPMPERRPSPPLAPRPASKQKEVEQETPKKPITKEEYMARRAANAQFATPKKSSPPMHGSPESAVTPLPKSTPMKLPLAPGSTPMPPRSRPNMVTPSPKTPLPPSRSSPYQTPIPRKRPHDTVPPQPLSSSRRVVKDELPKKATLSALPTPSLSKSTPVAPRGFKPRDVKKPRSLERSRPREEQVAISGS